MPTLDENKAIWDGEYHWATRGDEWSERWGSPSMEWYGTILPRINAHLPADRILEIACGHGRWTQFLRNECKHLVAVDLSEECIRACKQRFAEYSQIECHLNDGRSLDMIPDASVNFVFSFDSLVHADALVMNAYIGELPRILTEDGVAFLHHSNLGEYKRYASIRRVPALEKIAARLGLVGPLQWRDFTVDAAKVEALAQDHGLQCISQELLRWQTKRTYLDCFSTIVKKNSPRARSNRVLRNSTFMRDLRKLLQLSRLYDQNG
jgi:ubiquinone/menaquinone biosynthesis C-methylase UbiE